MKPITKEWVKKAEEDYRVARWGLKAKRPVYNAVCFHAQQSIEKYLKALLQENEVIFPKVHNLVTLMKLCLPILPELGSHEDEMKVLTAFSVEIRYPGTDATEADTKRSLQMLEQQQKAPAIIPLKHETYKVWVQKAGFTIPKEKEVEIKEFDTLYPVDPFQLDAIKVEGQMDTFNTAGEPFAMKGATYILHVKQSDKEIHQETLSSDGRFRLEPATHKWLAVGAEYELYVSGQPVLAVKPVRFSYDRYTDIHTNLTVTLDDIPPTMPEKGLELQITRLVVGEEIRGSIKASDEGLGLADAIEIQLQPPDNQKPVSIAAAHIQFREPDTYQFHYVLPDSPAAAGAWRILALTLQDKAGNQTHFPADKLNATFLTFASRYLLGKHYFEAENYQEALVHFKKVSPPTDDGRYLMALSYYHQGDLSQALTSFQTIESKTDYLGDGRQKNKKDLPAMPRKMVNKVWGELLDNLNSHKTDANYISLLAATAEELGRSYEAKVYGEYARQLRETPTKRSSKL